MTISVIACDVFGTIVDWHRCVSAAVDALNLGLDAPVFAREWRAGYQPAMARVRSGELGWTDIDTLHRMILDELLARHGVSGLDDGVIADLNRVWHRLDPWPDAVEGLTRLRRGPMLCTLSNGNIGLLADMAKRAALPWDCILSAENFGCYKPDPATYRGVAEIFSVPVEQVLMVAAHQSDLDAAAGCGLRTAYIERAGEFGEGHPKNVDGDPRNDFHASDLIDLADQLAA